MSVLEEPPKEVKKLIANFEKIFSPEVIRLVREYEPKDSDIFLAGTPKTGTSWTQHIMHGLRSGGSMDFNDMSEELPLIEFFYHRANRDIGRPQKYQPNMYKSHLHYADIPKGNAKQIVIVRDPPDVAVSEFYFYANWLYTKGEMTLEEYVDWFYLKPCPPYDIKLNALTMESIVQAYPYRKDKNVLWLHYEDLKANLKACIKLISDFMGIGVGNQDLLDLVEYQSSFEFMKKHNEKFSTKFNKQLTKSYLQDRSEDELKNSASKVRKGVIGEGRVEISVEQLKALDEKWKEMVTPVCGYQSYQEMRAGINKELGRPF
eukprot:g8456.t1